LLGLVSLGYTQAKASEAEKAVQRLKEREKSLKDQIDKNEVHAIETKVVGITDRWIRTQPLVMPNGKLGNWAFPRTAELSYLKVGDPVILDYTFKPSLTVDDWTYERQLIGRNGRLVAEKVGEWTPYRCQAR
jgi:hypothetical protein